jgi:hypothetical protein
VLAAFPSKNPVLRTGAIFLQPGNASMRPHIETGIAAVCGPVLEETGDFHMLATVAYWTHNALLAGMVLLTAALVVSAI